MNSIDKKAKTIITYFGTNLQLMKLAEELGELQTETARLILENQRIPAKGNIDNFMEELADVQLMLRQFILFMDMEDEINTIMSKKADRTLKRIREECAENGPQ